MMRRYFFIVTLACSLSLTSLQTTATEQKTAVNLPPSASLNYTIRADIKGLSLDGTSRVEWSNGIQSYTLSSETRTALTGVLLSEKSEGMLDEAGIAPQTFSRKRFRKETVQTHFDHKAGNISFSDNAALPLLKGGEQDRLSVLWQLLAMARAQPARFIAGSAWTFRVIGNRDGEDWVFDVKEAQKLRTVLGEVDTLHIMRVPTEKSGPTLDIWLAPSLDWFPVRLRAAEDNGDTIEQSLSKLEKK